MAMTPDDTIVHVSNEVSTPNAELDPNERKRVQNRNAQRTYRESNLAFLLFSHA